MNRNVTILVTLLLFSCSREIDFNPVNVEQELVVNALIQTGGRDSLLLSSTYITKSDGVIGAKIVVTNQGDTIGRYIEQSKGLYFYQGNRFQEKFDYSLSIQHPDYPSVLATTTIPVVPDFWFGTYADNGEKVKKYFEDDILIMGADMQVLLELEDDVETNDFYMLTASSVYENIYNERVIVNGKFETIEKRDLHYANARINSKSPFIELSFNGNYYKFAQNNIDWESGYRVWEDELFFSDKLFNGKKVTLPIDIDVAYNLQATKQVHLTLTSISKEYYQLLRSLATYEKSNKGFFPEALQLYSNVQNGHGVWAAKSSKTISLDISELDLFNYE